MSDTLPTEFGIDVHVTPSFQNHSMSRTCWCTPVVNYENPATGAKVIVHRKTNDGPHYESEAQP